jgi:hypothetical protein
MSSRTAASPAPPAASFASSTVAVKTCACGVGVDAAGAFAAGVGAVLEEAALFAFVWPPPPHAPRASGAQSKSPRRRFFRRMSRSL